MRCTSDFIGKDTIAQQTTRNSVSSNASAWKSEHAHPMKKKRSVTVEPFSDPY